MLLLCLAVAQAALLAQDARPLFEDFKVTYNRGYQTVEEEGRRYQCFQENLKVIDMHNARGEERHGINHFADLCASEFKQYHNLRVSGNRTAGVMAPLYSAEEVKRALADSVDWRTKGAVTHVKNQGQCGSCWSFSATGNMEGQWFLAGHTLVALSEEELVQCSKNGNQGCNGGLMDNAFEWVVTNGGIDSEADYPYTSGGGATGSCDESKLKNIVAKFTGHTDVAHDESQMATWTAANGPLSVAVDAASGWQTYSGGIMKSCTGRQLDHGVMVVGYGTDAGTDYWIVKNSWGASWGESGYIRLQRGTNQCGINMQPSSSKAGSGPVPPSPPSPPTPPSPPSPPSPPAPQCTSQSSFTQKQCTDSACSAGCNTYTFPTNQCVMVAGGGSAMDCCTATDLVEKVYTSSDCSGEYTIKKRQLNTCLQSSVGTYFTDMCASTGAQAGKELLR